MGDMLVKSGDWKTAQKVYAIARLSRTYATWPYRSVLEERVRRAPENVAVFNAAGPAAAPDVMIRSAFACVACHQESGRQFGRHRPGASTQGAVGSSSSL